MSESNALTARSAEEVRASMGSATDVTIVITSYQQASLISSSIASALAQTAPSRTIVVDDGSTDGSASVAEALGVETVRLPHQGALAAFRSGVNLVTTPFFVLLNADDELDPRYVEMTRALAEDPDVGFVYTGVRYFGSRVGTVSAPPFSLDTLKWGNYVHAGSLTRKAAYESVGGFDPLFRDHHEDWALWVALARKGWKGVAIDMPLLRYRRHPDAARNPAARRDIERARWSLFRRHPSLYGIGGLARLTASRLKLTVIGH